MQVLYSIWCLLAGCLAIGCFGIPLVCLDQEKFRKCSFDALKFWCRVPFYGISSLCVLLLTLARLGVRVGITTYIFVSVLGVLTIWLFIKKKVPCPPTYVFAALAACILLQAIPYFTMGAAEYSGYYKIDNMNAIASAQHFLDFNIRNAGIDSIHNRPISCLALAGESGFFRASRSVLMACAAALSGGDAGAAFGFISFLGPTLMFFCALLLLQRYANKHSAKSQARQAVWAVIIAVAPGYVFTHLDGFQTSTIMLPLLIFHCILVNELVKRNNPFATIMAGLLFCTATMMYTEMTFAFLILALVILFLALIMDGNKKQVLLHAFCYLLISAVCCLPYLRNYTTILFSGSFLRNSLDALYSYATTPEGLLKGFWGPLADLFVSNAARLALNLAAYALCVAALIGHIACVAKKKSRTSLGILCVYLSPLLPLLMEPSMIYQYYRLFLICQPLIILGCVYFLEYVPFTIHLNAKLRISNCALAFFMGAYFALASTLGTVYASWLSFSNGNAYSLTPSGEVRAARQDMVNQIKNEDLFVISDDILSLWWTLYYLRDNNIWLSDSSQGKFYTWTSAEGQEDHHANLNTPKIEKYSDFSFLNYDVPNTRPETIRIVYDPVTECHVDDSVVDDLGVILVDGYSEDPIRTPRSYFGSSSIDGFCKRPLDVLLHLEFELSGSLEQAYIYRRGEHVGMVNRENSEITLPIHIESGRVKIPLFAQVADERDYEHLKLVNWRILAE